MLRPTESPTLFLQQLGRGLRKAHGQDASAPCSTSSALHRKEFRFDRRFRALLGGSRDDIERAGREGFPFLPAGCHMELDPVAPEIVLRSIRDAIPTRWPAKVRRAALARRRSAPLAEFLDETGLELEDVYAGNRSWSDLREAPGCRPRRAGPHETRCCGRSVACSTSTTTNESTAYRALLASTRPPVPAALRERERRLLRMLVASIADQSIAADHRRRTRSTCSGRTRRCAPSSLELLGVLDDRVDHVTPPLAHIADVPLQIHARYTRIEILAAFGVGDGGEDPPTWQTGVYDAEAAQRRPVRVHARQEQRRLLADHPLPRLRHQPRRSSTGRASRRPRRQRDRAALHQPRDARARASCCSRGCAPTTARSGSSAPRAYVSHEGERPIAITWELHQPLPADLYQSFAAAVA